MSLTHTWRPLTNIVLTFLLVLLNVGCLKPVKATLGQDLSKVPAFGEKASGAFCVVIARLSHPATPGLNI